MRRSIGVCYKTELITVSQQVNPEKCSCISFENIGKDNATINNDIPCNPDNVPREFNNDTDCIIQDSFMLKFSGNSSDMRILVIKIFYNPI